MRINNIKLYAAMTNKEWSIKKLAEVSGVTRTTISYIKNGKSCSDETGRKLAKALDVNINELLA